MVNKRIEKSDAKAVKSGIVKPSLYLARVVMKQGIARILWMRWRKYTNKLNGENKLRLGGKNLNS